MKIRWCLCVSIIVEMFVFFSEGQVIQVWEITNFKAVTHFEGIERFYKARFEQEARMPPDEPIGPKRRAQIMQEICKTIFTSHFFRTQGTEWVDTKIKKNRKELLKHHKNIFLSVYDEYEYENRWMRTSGYGYDYVNAYRERRIQAGDHDHADEYVFRCAARDRLSRKIEFYWVSQPYDVNLPRGAYSIAARFVFNADLVLVAMAEEPAIGWRYAGLSTVATWLYALGRHVELTDNPDMDPVCSLSAAEKLRLCATLFAALDLEKKVRFSPTIENVQLKCVRKRISISFFRRFYRRRYEEWLLGCKALTLKKNKEVIYYAARGSRENTIFAFRGTGVDHQTVSLHNYYINVAVVPKMLEAATNAEADEMAPTIEF